MLNVNPVSTVEPLVWKLPHVVNLPVKSGSVGFVATKVPVWVNVARTRPSSKTVSCSTEFDVVVIVYRAPLESHVGTTSTNVSTRCLVWVVVVTGGAAEA